MYTWFSDLDSTLIYSYRNKFIQDKTLVEYLNGKEQSYMTMETYNFMVGSHIKFIPVTLRSVEQYNRVFIFKKEINVEHALVCNGAILLKNGIVDEEWFEETKKISYDGINVLQDIQNELSEYDIKNIEGVMLYFKTDKSKEVADLLRKKYADKKVYVEFDKNKMFIVPFGIGKGNAIKRYCKKFGITETISSGDSNFDISMFDVTNISIFPDSLKKKCAKTKGEKHIIKDGLIFSDEICKRLKIIIGL